MANEVHSPPEPTVTALVSGIITDAQELFKQQMALVRSEVKDDLTKTKDALLALALGVGAAVLGGLLVSLMLVYLLEWLARPHLPLWACYGIVAALFVIPGGISVCWGVRKFQSFNPLPDQSAEALKENVQWIANPK